MAADLAWTALGLLAKRQTDADPDEPDAGQQEISTSWSLFILIVLLILALFASYILQTRRIQAVHETVMSIFAGMIVGLILRLAASNAILSNVSFDYQMFFNLLLPPIILASGYELHQANFFRNIGAILTFAFAGTFISAVVLGMILFLWTRLSLDGVTITFVESMSVGATLSATDPVTILAIFTTYKVDPKLYTVIFGESILNDAVAIVLFETAQKYKDTDAARLTPFSLVESIGIFLLVFFGSLIIGLIVGMLTSLLLKFTHVRRFPKTESCIILLIAYASYFFSNAIHMSGIVTLLFCGICMKHYAYHNMSRRTQLTTKFIFQVLAQLSENFIFIYLGLSLFTESKLVFKPLFILITVVGICVARWCSVFPLSKLINWVIRYRAKRRGDHEAPDELPYSHQAMLFWAGLRGAVGVALAAGLQGPNGYVLRATVLVVVVLTVIIFGGTTARMLEILNIRTGVVEEIDSDDEFDIEYVGSNGAGTYSRPNGTAFGHNPRLSAATNGTVALGTLSSSTDNNNPRGTYSSGNSPQQRPEVPARRTRTRTADAAEQGLLSPGDSIEDEYEYDGDTDLDLPPAVRRVSPRGHSPAAGGSPAPPYPTSGSREGPAPASSAHGMLAGTVAGATAAVSGMTGAVSQLITSISEDPANAFRHIDESFIKPQLLLDPGGGSGGGGGDRSHGAGGSGV